MGEVQGSIWTTILFITLFFGMVGVLFTAMDIMNLNSGIFQIQDNLKAGSLDDALDLSDNFNVCSEYALDYDTYPIISASDGCTGITEQNNEKRFVRVHVEYDGITSNYVRDFTVLLAY